MKKTLLVAIASVILCGFGGCPTRELTPEEKTALTAGQTVAGVPLPLAIAITNLISLGLGHLGGHKLGRRKERKVQECKLKEHNHG